MNARKTRRRFTQEFKDDAVSLVVEQGHSSAEVACRPGVSENNVNRWIRQYRDKYENASTDGLTREQLETERKRLRNAAKLEVLDYISFYNGLRLRSTLGYVSPMDYEKERLKNAA